MPSHTKRRLSARERTELDRAKQDLQTIRAAAGKLDEATLAELLVRARYSATQGITAPGGGGGNDVAKPTEAAVIEAAGGRIIRDGETDVETFTRDTWQGTADPVRAAIADLFNHLTKAADTLATVEQRREYITTIASTDAGDRKSSLAGDCQCCDRPVLGTPDDRLISGYCKPCRNAWEYQGYPDRVAFQKAHQAKHTQPDPVPQGA